VRVRFLALYVALGAVVCLSGFAAYATFTMTPLRVVQHRCWTTGPNFSFALHGAANCRFGARNVYQLGWMPYLGATERQQLEEVAVIRPDGGATFWIAAFSALPQKIRIEHWAPCAASNPFC
jgi:hypothetical protein